MMHLLSSLWISLLWTFHEDRTIQWETLCVVLWLNTVFSEVSVALQHTSVLLYRASTSHCPHTACLHISRHLSSFQTLSETFKQIYSLNTYKRHSNENDGYKLMLLFNVFTLVILLQSKYVFPFLTDT